MIFMDFKKSSIYASIVLFNYWYVHIWEEWFGIVFLKDFFLSVEYR